MYDGKRIISIIPARGGSKSIPQKNIKKIAGLPLIAYSIYQSKNSQYIDETIVSTDDMEIAEISKKYGATVIKRPKELAKDETPTEPVMIHVLNKLLSKGNKIDCVVLLQPTSPIRRRYDIDNAIKQLIDSSGDSLLSVYENKAFYWSKKSEPLNYDYKCRPRRQDKEWELVENGSIYITKKDTLLKEKCRLGGKITTYIMPHWASYEIDEPFDLEIVEYLINKKMDNIIENLEKIKLIIFDVDGVFTDGSVYVNEKGEETLKFSRIDGKGIEMLQKNKIKIVVISSEDTLIINHRMKKLKIPDVFCGIKNKVKVYEKLKNEQGFNDEEIAYCGDDLGDLNIIRKAGFSACPKNAIEKIKKECNYVSSRKGGNGFVREICEFLLDQKIVDKNE